MKELALKNFLHYPSAKVVSTLWLNLALNLKEELLSKEEAIQMLYGNLQDIGWKEGDAVNLRHGQESLLDDSHLSNFKHLMERETTVET